MAEAGHVRHDGCDGGFTKRVVLAHSHRVLFTSMDIFPKGGRKRWVVTMWLDCSVPTMIYVFLLPGGGTARRSNHTQTMFSIYQSRKVIPTIKLPSSYVL